MTAPYLCAYLTAKPRSGVDVLVERARLTSVVLLAAPCRHERVACLNESCGGPRLYQCIDCWQPIDLARVATAPCSAQSATQDRRGVKP